MKVDKGGTHGHSVGWWLGEAIINAKPSTPHRNLHQEKKPEPVKEEKKEEPKPEVDLRK